jgi:NlpC/P60 family
MARNFSNLLILLLCFPPMICAWPSYATSLANYQDKIKMAGDDMLENLEVSYVYGGANIGDGKSCEACNQCLEDRQPAPKLRFKECSVCSHCSIDCSHFTQLVFAKAGLAFPYITTAQMLELSIETLEKRFHLRSLGNSVGQIIPGDMLVYRGHVAIVESIHGPDSADIIHATGGKDIRVPGQGIQRERFVRMSSFRGDLLRVVRHARLDQLNGGKEEGAINQFGYPSAGPTTGQSTGPTTGKARPFKLRRVEKRRTE